MDRPRIKYCYRWELVPSAGIFLLSEAGHYLLRGAVYEHLVPMLDGSRCPEELIDALDGKASAPEVLYALEILRSKGYLSDASIPLAPEQAVYWELLGVDLETATRRLADTTVSVTALGSVGLGPFLGQLEALGIHSVPAGGDRQIVLTDDYLRQELAAINAEALAEGRPWLLIRPVGLEMWLGPIFVPGQTGCWACLEHRLAMHRMLERHLCERKGLPGSLLVPRAALPSSVHAALGLAGTETARWLVQETSALTGQMVTLETRTLEKRTHVLTRRPQCPACGDPALVSTRQRRPPELHATTASFTSDGGHRVEGPDATLARLEHHISVTTGLIGGLTRLAEGVTVSYIANQNFAFIDDEGFFVRKHQRTYSGGKGKSDVQARMSAVGEAIERYAGLFQGDEARIRARLADLGDAAIHPNAVMLYSERQLAERERWNREGSRFTWVPERFDAGQEIEWSPLWPLLGGPERYVPTALCYYGHGLRHDLSFARADSNGCAAGATLEEAVYQGLLELVERDATALWWYNRISRPGVDLASFDEPYLAELEAHYRSIHRSLWALDLTSDLGIPAFVAISRRTDQPPEDIFFGFGAHLDPQIALLRAVTELNQFLPGVTRIPSRSTNMDTPDDEGMRRWLTAATLDSDPYLMPAPSLRPRRLDDFPAAFTGNLHEDILRCARLLQGKGLEVLVLDQTRPDTGLYVARVMVPGLRHFWARLAPGRLYDVPAAMGWLARPRREDELNPTAMFV